MVIEDGGKGFDAVDTGRDRTVPTRGRRRLGLSGMRERFATEPFVSASLSQRAGQRCAPLNADAGISVGLKKFRLTPEVGSRVVADAIAARCGTAMLITPKPKADPDQQFAIRLMEHLVVPTFVLDSQSRVIVWNKACERLTGLLADEVLQTSNHWQAFYDHERPCLADLVIQSDYSSIRALYDNSDAFGFSDVGVSVENWCVMPRIGHKLCLAFDAGPIYDDSGSLIAVVETVRDITAQQAAQKTLEKLAASDGLTGLANRRSFDQALASEIKRAARHDDHLSLLMLDVDCFKSYNDTYGHQKGDECLRAVAQAMAEEVKRAGDLPARYGGEEFAVILPQTDIEQAGVVAERIRCSVAKLGIPHRNASAGASVTISIGVAAGKGTDLDASRLLASADEALYKSKHEGRNRVTALALEPALLLF